METDGGGWTVFQRRMDGSVDFYRNWIDYVHGFGNTSGEHWLGLSKIHRLANGSVSTQLRVDMRDKNGNSAYASYSTFYIGGSTTDYTLHVSGYSGTAGDCLSYYNLRRFCTKDKTGCSVKTCCCGWWCNNECSSGVWWYNKGKGCHCNLNCPYNNTYNIWSPNNLIYKPCFLYVEMKLRHI